MNNVWIELTTPALGHPTGTLLPVTPTAAVAFISAGWAVPATAPGEPRPTIVDWATDAELAAAIAALPPAPVASVNGKTGAVALTAADVAADPAGAATAAQAAAILYASGAIAGLATTAAVTAGLAGKAAADPVLSNFSYDPSTGNLLSYKEDGITITMTYNADGTVATTQRGSATARTYSYSGGNLVGVA